MSATDISRSDFAKALEPVVGKWFHTATNDYQADYKKIFQVEKLSGRAYVEHTLHSDTGLLQAIPEGEATPYNKMSQGYTKRYTAMDYRDGLSVTQNMIDDSISLDILAKKSKALGRAAAHTQDVLAMQVLNRAFTAAYAGGDGKELCATDHPTKAGDMSNELATPADLSEASLEQADQEMGDILSEEGLRISVAPKALVIPRASKFNAHRIIRSDLRQGTANNDANAMNDMNLFPGGIIVSDRLTDDNAFFLTTNQPDGLTFIDRKSPTMSADTDFETDSAKFKIHMRLDVGWTDPRGVFGSPGSS